MTLTINAHTGLGKAMVVELLAHGDTVVGADVDAPALERLREQYPSAFIPLPMNVGDAASVKEAAARLDKYAGGKPCLDAIVNNAGILRGGPFVEVADSMFAAALAVNVLGTFHTTKYFFPLLKRDGDGGYRPRVINLGSEVSYAGVSSAFNGIYSITKFAIEAYSTALRQEFNMLENSVMVTILCPGAHVSEMTDAKSDTLGLQANLSKSLFALGLTKVEKHARKYIDSKKRPASDVGKAVLRLVHLYNPPRRQNVNVSWEMFFAKFTPQFVLDSAVDFLSTW